MIKNLFKFQKNIIWFYEYTKLLLITDIHIKE